MRQLHEFVTKHWRFLLITFVVLSGVFAFLNSKFSAEAAQGCFEEVKLERLNSQAFTSSLSFDPLHSSKWQSFVACYEANPTAKSLNTAIFILDDVWALFFLAAIYLLGNIKNFVFTPLKRVLLVLLLIAYAFDFTENAIYLTLSEVRFLPTLGTLKFFLRSGHFTITPHSWTHTHDGKRESHKVADWWPGCRYSEQAGE